MRLYDPDVRPPTTDWLHRVVAMCRAALAVPELRGANVSRDFQDHILFPLKPPIASAYHAVITTDADVDAAYLDPTPFWHAWDTIERVGDLRFCTRALDLHDPADDGPWLGRTFFDSMAMARAARPGLTKYDIRRPGPELAPFWEPGPFRDDKAGTPVLTPVGYDATTRTAEYTGFLPDPEPGGPEPHLLVRDIMSIRHMARLKKTSDGRPVDTIRIVFPTEAMARPERRPLLDCGARVYFLGSAGDLIEITD